MSDKLTLQDMIADMGIGLTEAEFDKLKAIEDGAPLDIDTLTSKHEQKQAIEKALTKSNNPSNAAPSNKGKTFHNRQFTLISCGYFKIYLQSVLPIDNIEPDNIGEFLKLAVASSIGYKGPNNPPLKEFMRHTIDSKAYLNFYTDKEWHMNWLKEAQELGLIIDPNKLANRQRALATINEYLDSLADHLTIYGCKSAEEYLLKNPKRSSKVRLDNIDLINLWDDL